jgi:Ni,Fe-hydrogenase III large subunit
VLGIERALLNAVVGFFNGDFGDSPWLTVGDAGLEGTQAVIPPRAAWLRALALECERIANHLGDLGALGNDAGLSFGLAQFSRLKEIWLRASEAAFAQRYPLDFMPGDRHGSTTGLSGLVACAGTVATVQKLTITTNMRVFATVSPEQESTPELTAQLGLTGMAGRASGQAFDLRIDRRVPRGSFVSAQSLA